MYTISVQIERKVTVWEYLRVAVSSEGGFRGPSLAFCLVKLATLLFW